LPWHSILRWLGHYTFTKSLDLVGPMYPIYK
jgi:hypothetical protein